jgi:hypothetical protein
MTDFGERIKREAQIMNQLAVFGSAYRAAIREPAV